MATIQQWAQTHNYCNIKMLTLLLHDDEGKLVSRAQTHNYCYSNNWTLPLHAITLLESKTITNNQPFSFVLYTHVFFFIVYICYCLFDVLNSLYLQIMFIFFLRVNFYCLSW